MSNHEQFAQVAQRKWAIMSESLRSLTKNERMSELLIFLSKSLILSFLGNKRIICLEIWWANSQPWWLPTELSHVTTPWPVPWDYSLTCHMWLPPYLSHVTTPWPVPYDYPLTCHMWLPRALTCPMWLPLTCHMWLYPWPVPCDYPLTCPIWLPLDLSNVITPDLSHVTTPDLSHVTTPDLSVTTPDLAFLSLCLFSSSQCPQCILCIQPRT